MNASLAEAPLASNKTEFEHFKIMPISPALGGVIEGFHLSELTEESAAELRTALWRYGVLIARDQHLTFSQQKAVARCFAEELEHHTFGRTMASEGHPEVLLIEKSHAPNDRATTDIWHHDVTPREHPNVVGVLQADEVPFGADTMWASATAAYDRLPFALKLMFLNLDIDHDSIYGTLRHDFAATPARLEKLFSLSSREIFTHPAVIHHPFSGKLSLFVGNGYLKRVHRVNTDLGELIIRIANEMPRTPEIQMRHQWRKGDVAIWDNFGTAHYGVAGDVGDQLRRLHRVAAWSKKIRPTLDRARAMRELLAEHAASSVH